MAQTIVGLDIGATSIKVTRLEASLFRFEFKDSSEHMLPTHMDLPWEQLVSSVLQVIFSDQATRPEKIIASLPGRAVSSRVLDLPFTDKKKIEQTLPFEIEGQVPFPIEEVLTDYKVLETASGTSKIFVICTPKKILDTHLKVFKDSGIDPQIVITPAVSLANLYKQIQGDSPEPFMIVDFGDSETAISTVFKGQLLFCRTLVTGSSRLTKDLEQGLQVSYGQAADIKEHEADLSPDGSSTGDSRKELVARILATSLQPLVGGIKQSLVSVQEATGVKPEKIYLCGKGAKLKGLETYLSGELAHEVLTMKFSNAAGSSHPPLNWDPLVFAASMGLALHGTRDNAASRLNLRTGEYGYVSSLKAFRKTSFSVGAMLAALLLLFVINEGLKYHYRHAEFTRIQSAIDQVAQEMSPDLKGLRGDKQKFSMLTSKLDEERRELSLFASISPNSLSVLDVINAITQAIPQDVKIDVRELAMEGDKIRIQGETASSNAAEQIKNNLLQSGTFASAEIPEVKDSLDHSTVKFQMNLQLQSRSF